MLTLNSNQSWSETEKQVWSEFVVYFMVYSTLLVGFGIASDDSGAMLDSFRFIEELEGRNHEQMMKILYLWQTNPWQMAQAMGLVDFNEVIIDASLSIGEKAVESIKKEILMPIGGFVVGGLKKLSPFGSASAQVNSWDGSASTDWQDPANWSLNQIPEQAFIIEIPSAPSNQPDLNTADGEAGSLFICAGATLTGSGREVDIYGEHPGTSENVCSSDGGGGTYGSGYAFLVAGALSGNLKLEIKTPMFTLVDLVATSGNIYDLNINTSGNYVESTGSPTINGDVTVTNGVFRSSSYGTTMTIGGKLTVKNGSVFGYDGGNAGAMNYTIGSLDLESGGKFINGFQSTTLIDSYFTDGNNITLRTHPNAIFNHNYGTLKFTETSTVYAYISGNGYPNDNDDAFFNMILDGGTIYFHPTYSDHMWVHGDITVTAGELRMAGSSQKATVYGDVRLLEDASGSPSVQFVPYDDNWTIHGILEGTNGAEIHGYDISVGSLRLDDGVLQNSASIITIIGTGGILEGDLDAGDTAFDIDLDHALDFPDDNTQFVNLGTFCDATCTWTNGITSSAWVYRTGTDEDFVNVIEASNGFSWSIFSNGQVWWYAGDLSLANAKTSATGRLIPSNSWQHVAVSYDPDADSMTVYLNGEIMWDWCPSGCGTTATITGTVVNSGQYTHIGKWTNASYNWKGMVADSRIHDVPLDIEEIRLMASRINRETPTTPVGWWKLNEGTGLPQDYSGNGHHATVSSADWIDSPYSVNLHDGTVFGENVTVTNGTLEGLSLTAVDFNGSSSRIALGSTVDCTTTTNGGCAFAVWWKPEATQYHTFFAGGTSAYYDFGHGTNTQYGLRFMEGGSWVYAYSAAVAVPTLNQWYHSAVVVTSTTVNFYQDGVDVGCVMASGGGPCTGLTITNNVLTGGGVAVLGAETTDGSGCCEINGDARDFRIYDQGLSSYQVSSLYAGSLLGGMIHHWKLDDGSGNAADSVGSNTGAIQGATFENHPVNIGNLWLGPVGIFSAPRGELILDGYHATAGVGNWYTLNMQGSETNEFIHNNGTVHFKFTGTDATIARFDELYDVKVTLSSSSYRVNWRANATPGEPTSNMTATILNDLTMIEGDWRPNIDTQNLTVGGYVIIESGGTIGWPGIVYTGTWSFRSLTIDSGGYYYATSGTTNINGFNGSWTWKNDGGTFVHNDGKVVINAAGNYNGNVNIKENTAPFYDLVITGTNNGDNVKWYPTSGTLMVVDGDLTVMNGTFKLDGNPHHMTVYGNTHVQQGAILFDSGQNHYGDYSFHGLVRNEGTFLTSAGDNFFYGGLRTTNAFACLSTNTVTFKGTGGIWEGSLDDCIVVVDLDAALEIKSSCTNAAYLNYFTCTDNGGTWSGTIARVSDDTVIRLAGSCSAGGHLNKTTCETAGETWTGSDKTLSIWYKTPGPEEFAQLLSTGGDSSNLMAKYYYTYALRIRWFSNGGDVLCDDSSTAYRYSTGRPIDQPDTWYHIACTGDWDAVANSLDNMHVFVNGVNVDGAKANGDGGSGISTGALYFGGHAGNPPELVGTIADAKIYSKVLTDADIMKLASYIHYPNSNLADAGFLKGSWAFNEGAFNTCSNGEDVCDLSGNNNTVAFTSPPSVDYVNWVYPYTLYLMHSATTAGDLTVTKGTLDGSGLSSLEFDGVDDYITISGDTINTPTTVSLWAKLDSAHVGMLISRGTDDFELYSHTSTGNKFWTYWGSAVQTTCQASFTVGKWTHLVYVIDGSTEHVYQDGVYLCSGTTGGSVYANDGDLIIGKRVESPGTEQNFDGYIADIKFFETKLSTEQAEGLYTGRYLPPPTHHWKLGGEAIDRNGVISDHGTASFLDPDGNASYNGVSGTSVGTQWGGGYCDSLVVHQDVENTVTCSETTTGGGWGGFGDGGYTGNSTSIWDQQGHDRIYENEVYVAEFDLVVHPGTAGAGPFKFGLQTSPVGSSCSTMINLAQSPATSGRIVHTYVGNGNATCESSGGMFSTELQNDSSGTQSYSISNFKMTKYTGAVGTMSGFGSDPFQHAVMEAGDVDIAADGTLKAPHGIFKINVTSSSNSFDNMGTFIHNEGTVWNVASGGKFMKTGTVDPVFYNIACTANFEINYSITVENELNCYAIDIRDGGQQVLISLGTTISQGIGRSSMASVPTAASGSWQIENNATYSHGVVGVSSQFPARIIATRSDGQSMIRNTGTAGDGLTLGNVVIDGTFGKWGNAASINLVGDVWIDHLYIQTGATFDTNSYALTITSLTNHGTLSGDGAIIHTGTQGALLADVGSRDYTVDLDSVFSFDGTDDYLNAGDVLDFADNDEFTVSVWFRTTATERQVIVGKYLDRDANKAGWGIEMEADGTIKAGAGDGSYGWRNADSTLSYNDGYWHHIGWTVSGSNQRLLIDGVIVDTVSTHQLASMESSYDLLIGAKNQNTANTFFTGEIADVKIYRDNLDHTGWGGSASVGELHRLGAYINITGEASGPEILMVWWKLTNGSVKDSSYDGSSLSCLAGTTCSNYILGEYGSIEEIYPFTTEYRNGANANGDINISNGTLDLERTSIAEFNGVDDYVEIAGALDSEFSSAFTWSLWVKTDASSYPIGSEEYLLGAESASSNNWDVAFETDGQIRANYKSGGTAVAVTSSTSLDTGWNHIIWVVSCDDSNCTSGDAYLYINGLLEDDISHSINMSNTVYTVNAQIGDRNHSGNGPFDGDITDVRLYTHALTEEQALALYTNQYPVTPDHWWLHQFTSTTTIEDYGRDSVTDVDATFGTCSNPVYVTPSTCTANSETWSGDGGWSHHSEAHNSLFIGSNGRYKAGLSTTTIDSNNSGGWAVNFERGYYESNGGQLHFTGGSASAINLGNDGYPNHVLYNRSSISCFAGPPWDQHLAGKLTVSNGTLELCDDRIYIVAVNDGIKVTGGTLDFTGSTGAHEYGKLEITGGTFKAPDYAKISANGSARISWTGGTLVHNNGTFEITGGNGTGINVFGTTGNLYNVILNNGECDVCTISLLGYSAGTPSIIEGDLTAIRGTIIPNTGTHDYTVYGTTTIHSAATFNNSSTAGDWVYHGIVTNYGDYTFSSNTNTFHGGFRNLGTTHGSSTATFVGTGGIWEGDLDDVDVDIDLDTAYRFTNESNIKQYVKTNGHSIPATGDFTISWWMSIESMDTHMYPLNTPIGGGGGEGLGVLVRPTSNANYGMNFAFHPTTNGTGCTGGNSTSVRLTQNSVDPHSNMDPNTWHHWTVTVDRDGNLTSYMDGNPTTYVTDISADENCEVASTYNTLYMGTTSYAFDGMVVDVRIYSGLLDPTTEIPLLAAKINGETPTLPTPLDWWKLTGTTTPDVTNHGSAGSSDDGVANNSPEIVSLFSIVVIGSASNGGDADIINGTLEGLGLSSLDFDGTDDIVVVDDFDMYNGATEGSFCIWVNPDGVSGSKYIATKYDTTSTGNREFQIYIDDSFVVWNVQDNKTTHSGAKSIEGSTALVAGEWYHLCGTFSTTNGQKIYVNGVLDGTAANNITTGIDDSTSNLMFGANQSSSPANYFDGSMRDALSFRHELSSEQVASLYGGSYLVTPEHNWKLGGSMADGLYQSSEGNVYYIADGTDGTELWEGPDSRFDSGTYHWYADNGSTLTNDNNTLKIEAGSASLATHTYLQAGESPTENQIVGNYYNLSFDTKVSSGTTVNWTMNTIGNYLYVCPSNFTSEVWYRCTLTYQAEHASQGYLYLEQTNSGETIWIDNISLIDLGPAPGTMSGTMTDSSFTHATFDFGGDKQFKIYSGGTFSAPRGNFEVQGNFMNDGTYIHNKGTLIIDGGDVDTISGSQATILYNFTAATLGGGEQTRLVDMGGSLTIENLLDIQTQFWFHSSGPTVTLTMGTMSQSGEIRISSGNLSMYQTGGTATIQAASEEHPVIITRVSGNFDFEDANTSIATTWNLKWVDIQFDITTGGSSGSSNVTLTLAGDSQFRHVTIGEYDTFAIAGNTAYVTGIDSKGTVTGSTIEFVGSGGFWAGDLGPSDVNVNMDPTLLFDGTNDHVEVVDSNSLDVSAEYTISVWVKANSDPTTFSGMIIQKGGDTGSDRPFQIYNNSSNNTIEFGGYNLSASGYFLNVAMPASYIAGEWLHIILVKDSGGMVGYFNGESVGTLSSFSASAYVNADSIHISSAGSVLYYDGLITDARIYDSVVSSSDLATLSSSMGVSTAANPVGWWLLNEGTGNPQDSSGNMNHGVNNGATWTFDEFSLDVHEFAETNGDVSVTRGTLEGKSMTSLLFDGLDDVVTVADTSSLSFTDGSNTDKPFTFSAWINADANSFPILSKGEYGNGQAEYALLIGSTGKLALELYDESESGNPYLGQQYQTAFTLNQWVHVTATYDASEASSGIKLYIDGVLVPTTLYECATSCPGSYLGMENNNDPFKIGAAKGPSYADGNIRDVRIYDYDLSAEQVASVYSGSYPVTPLHWWMLDGVTSGPSNIVADTGWGTADGTKSGPSYQHPTLEIGRLALSNGATVSAPRGIMELDNSGMVFETIGGTTYIHNNGEIEVTVTQNPGGLSIVRFRSGTGTPFDLTIDVGSGTPAQWDRDLTVSGTLWIDTGVFSSSATQRDIIVVGQTDIDYPGRLNCASGKICSLGSGFTDGHAVVVANGAVLDGGSSVMTMGSLDAGWGADVTFSSSSTTFDSTNGNNNRVWLISQAGSFDFDDGEVIFTGTATQNMYLDGNCDIPTTTTHCRTFKDFTVNKASGTLSWENGAAAWADIYITGDLKISSGTFDTESNYHSDLYVTGEFNHTGGTFTSNSSIVTVRNLVITNTASTTFNAPDASGMLNITGEGSSGSGDGYAFRRVSGAFVDNSGTVTFKLGGDYTSIRMGTAAQNFHNVIIDESTSGGIYYVNDEGFTVTGDLTLTDGDFDTGYGSTVPLIDIQGTLSIGNHNTFGGISGIQTSDISIGCLIIASSGATFIGSSGTTTITKDCNSGNVWQNLRGDNGYVHNNGTVDIHGLGNYNGNVVIYENSFYNLIVNMNSTSDNCYWNDISGGVIKIEGDLTITNGEWKAHAGSDDLIIYGTTYVSPTSTFHNTAWHNYTNVDVTHYGLVTVDSLGAALGLYDATPANNLIYGGFRNLGGTVVGSTLTFVGSGGIWEGDLGTADVDIDLDMALDFDGGDDYMVAPHTLTDNYSGEVTFSVWFNADTTSDNDNVFSLSKSTDMAAWEIALHVIGDDLYLKLDTIGGPYWKELVIDNVFDQYENRWVHVACVIAAAENDTGCYVNGVWIVGAVTNPGGYPSSADRDYGTTDALYIGGGHSMNNLFDGTVMDFRVYTAHVSDADIQLLASQIGRPTLATPELWWMLNEGTGTDAFNTGYCGGTASNCDGEIFDGGSLGATWLDSPFSIVAQGEDTGTGGDVDIIQGTLEGLGLTSLAFDNTDDYLNFTGFNPGNDFSGFAWVNPVDLDTGDDVIFGGPTNDRKQLDFNDAYQLRYHDNDLVNPSCTYDIDEADYNGVWTHVGVTRIGTTTTLFVNGAVVQTCTQTNSTDNDITYIGYTGSSSQYFNGSIRDVRIYDYTLSTDQAASLYAGSYLVTPLHNWKMDEGTGVNTVADTGSGTTLTATQNGCTSAPCPAWQNADLDLDGALYLHAETTLSAPRGSIEVAGKYTQYGTYTHHDGLFHLDGNVQETQWGAYTIGPFYDLQTSGTTTEIRSHMIVEHHLTLTSTCTLPSYTNAIWTMGTLTSPGKIIGTASNPVCVHDNLMDASPDYFTVKAADTTGTHLVEITGNNWDWSYVGTPQGIKFGSVDVQFDLNIQNDTSGGFGNTIVLIDDYSVFKTLTISGNAEFDPDTFDLKLGKGVGGNSRIIDCNGTFNPSGGNLTITGNTGDIRANWFQANPFDVTIDLTNPTDTLNADSSGGGAFQLQRDLIINKGIYNTDSTANHPITVGRHIILQNNGTLTPNSSTVTIATDFDSSAGTITNGDVGWHLVMTGTGTWTSASPNNHKVYDITVGTSGLRTVAGSPYIYGLLTVNSNGIGGGGGITIGLSGPTAPVMNGGATFVNIGQVIYQCGTTCYATGTDYNTIRISAGSDVILTGDIGDAHQVKLDGGTTFTTNGYDITTNIVNHTGDDIFITGGSDFKFEHSYVGNGFGSSYGDLNADGFAGAVFDGTNDYLNVPIDTTGFTSITWTTWVFHQQGTTGALIKSFQWDSGYHIGFHSAFKVYVATDIATQQECAGVGFLDDVWNFVGISVSPSEINIYVKNSGGETTTTCAITTGTGAYIPSTNPSVHLGSGSGWSGAYLDGYMADARVFDSALTSANITSIYGTGTHDENNPATNEGNVYTSYGSPEAWYRLNDGDDFNSGAAGGVVDSAGTNHGQAKNGTQSGEVLITSTSATPSNYWDFRTGMDVTANHATFEGYGMYANDGGGDNDVINSTFINLGGGEAVYFHGNGSVTRFSHNTITAAAAGLFAYSITVANLDNITINGVLSAYDVRADNAQIELTNSYFDETNVSNINGGDVVSINHNGATDYYVFATTLDYSDIINKVQTSHSNIHLYEGTWNLDENTNFQTATLTITSGTLKVTSENTWGTVTPANVNSYPVIEGAVLYWWNAVFNPLAIPRDVNAGLVKYNTGSYYDIYGVVTESTVNVGWSVNDVGILGEIPVRLIGTQGAHCSTYCQTKWVIDENVEMRNLTIYNNSKFDQVPNGAASVYSRYDPAYSGVYVQTGGLWSIVGTSAFNAYAERLSGLSAGIWNLTPQACNPSLLHIDLANIRHEFEPCGMIPYFAATLTDTWPGNDTIWWTSYKTATPSEIGAKFVSNGIQISTPERRNEDWTSLRVMILSNITQPQNLTADLWIKRGDNPATAFDECNKGPACVWTKISMTNHLNGDYTASFKFYWDGRYEFFIEANDTKNDITDHFFITYLKQKGPFEALYGMMPAWITVAVVGAFVPIITGLPRKYGV